MIRSVAIERERRIERDNRAQRSIVKVVEKGNKAGRVRTAGRLKHRRKRSFESRDREK